MSNLSDLLPAGAAAKQLTFTDSGSGISSKAPVVLNSDGTVSAVSNTAAGGGTATLFNAATSLDYNAIVYDSANNKMVIFYQDGGNSYYGTAIVGTVSGTSISYGSPVVFNSASTSYINATYDPDTSQTVTVYRDSTTYGAAIVGSVSGTSISFGSEAVYASVNAYYHNVTYDTTNDKVVIAYMDAPSGSYGKSIIGTVSGTSISYGSATTFESGSTSFIGICYDSSNDRTVISYQDGDDSYKGKAVVGTTSGTSISFGSAVTFDSGSVYETAAAFDTGVNRVLIAYRLSGSGGVAVAGEVSGTSITFGGTVLITSEPLYIMGIAFDANAGKTIIPYNTPSNTAAYRLASISGTTTTLDSEVAFNAPAQPKYPFVAYNSTEKVDVITFYNNLDNYGYSTVVQVADVTNAQDFVGVADSAISASAAGSIIVQGGTVTGVSSGTGLSMGATVQYSASNLADIYASQAVFDSTNNKMVIVYDGSGSGAGYGIVGTISGTSVSYGSAVQYSGGNARHSQVTYDSTNQRVVVVYSDDANSRYLTVAVGTVSGTSISWGTPVVADSTADDMYLGIDFDINAGKVLIIWKEDSTAYNYGIVGTVSGTSISFGTKATVDTSYGYQMIGGLTYDANAQKHLFFRPRTGGTVADGYVGTISGTSVSWGSATSATTTQSLSVGWGSYDSNAQKVVVTYRIGAGGMGSQVATISGTSVSFGTQVVVDASINPDFTTNYYDSTDQTIVAFGRATNYYGYVGTVSGTSISWSSASTLLLDAAFGYGLGTPAYDANADAGLILFANAGDSAAESAVTTAGALPLTTGTKYYVTTSGGFSSSADTPSVNAGLAISTTSLLLNGDS